MSQFANLDLSINNLLSKSIIGLLSTISLISCSMFSQDTKKQVVNFISPSTSIESKIGVSSEHQSLSKPAVGTVFAFDNPSEIFTVIGSSEFGFELINTTGNFMTVSSDTWLPPIQWGGGASNTDSGRRIISPDPNNPSGDFSVGQVFSYDISTFNDRPSSFSRYKWQCKVQQIGKIQIAAGVTDTVEFLCKEDGVEKLLINYSPELNFYVRHVLMTSSGPVVRELTAYRKGHS